MYQVEPRPVDGSALEAPPQLEPLAVAHISVAPGLVEVDPLLERIDRCAVREEQDDALEQVGSRAPGVLLRVVASALFADERRSEELHRHRSHLCHLGPWMPLKQER
jgi:hypothetical protein